MGVHISFLIKKQKKDKKGSVPVYCRISTSTTDRAEYYTKIRIEESRWLANPKRNGAGMMKYIKGSTEVIKAMNERLNIIEERVIKEYNKHIEQQTTPSASELRNAITGKKDKTLQDVFEIIIQRASEESSSSVKSRIKSIQKFIEEEYNQETIRLLSFRQAKYKSIGYILTDWGKKKGYSSNYIKGLFTKIKEALNLAVNLGYIETHNVTYKLRGKAKSKVKEKLSQDEVRKLEELVLEDEELIQARDTFLFQIYTGLSHIDVKKLSPEHLTKGIDGRTWIVKDRQKSKSTARIPLIQRAQNLLDSYKHLTETILPVESHNNVYNSRIEKLMEKLSINKHITSHCARHTFATFLRDAGSDLNNIKDIAGHSNSSMTEIYAKMTPERLSKEMDGLDKMLGS